MCVTRITFTTEYIRISGLFYITSLKANLSAIGNNNLRKTMTESMRQSHQITISENMRQSKQILVDLEKEAQDIFRQIEEGKSIKKKSESFFNIETTNNIISRMVKIEEDLKDIFEKISKNQRDVNIYYNRFVTTQQQLPAKLKQDYDNILQSHEDEIKIYIDEKMKSVKKEFDDKMKSVDETIQLQKQLFDSICSQSKGHVDFNKKRMDSMVIQCNKQIEEHATLFNQSMTLMEEKYNTQIEEHAELFDEFIKKFDLGFVKFCVDYRLLAFFNNIIHKEEEKRDLPITTAIISLISKKVYIGVDIEKQGLDSWLKTLIEECLVYKKDYENKAKIVERGLIDSKYFILDKKGNDERKKVAKKIQTLVDHIGMELSKKTLCNCEKCQKFNTLKYGDWGFSPKSPFEKKI